MHALLRYFREGFPVVSDICTFQTSKQKDRPEGIVEQKATRTKYDRHLECANYALDALRCSASF